MPCFIRVLTPHGLEPVDYIAQSLAEAAQVEPENGIYTVTNTFNITQTLKFDAHLDRMEDSARRAGMTFSLDRERLKKTLRTMILEAGYGSVRFRVTVPHDQPDHFIISLEPFTGISPELIEHGVRVITVPNSARKNAAAKTTDWMHQRTKIIASMPPGVYDAILRNERDELLEGLGANFYAIVNGELRTAGEDVLPGIAQQIVFEIAPSILPVRQEAITVSDIPQVQEAFITSSSRGIVPVVEIDGHSLGIPGERTRALRAAYADWVQSHLEEL
ncbi:MAG: D-amino-acid transaminase [Anaerolineae bacterium]